MKAFHDSSEVKKMFTDRMKAHIEADELVRGIGYENGKGCAVGCILNKYEHDSYPVELGLPEWSAHLLDTLHENCSDEVWPTLSLEFLEAIPVGSDIDPVLPKIHLFIQRRNLERVEKIDSLPSDVKSQVVSAISGCIALYDDPSDDWSDARSAAASAAASDARSAASDARYHGIAAWSSAASAAASAEYAAVPVDQSAKSVVTSVAYAKSAAEYAAASAAASAGHSSAYAPIKWRAVRYAEHDIMALEFIRLLKNQVEER